MKTTIEATLDPLIKKAIQHVLDTCGKKYKYQIVKRNRTMWYEFWNGDYREFFIEDIANQDYYVVFKRDSAKAIARDVAMILSCKLIDPNDIEIPI